MLKVLKRKFRVHSLTGRISSRSLRKAFKAVKKNRGAAGLDKQTIEMFEANLDENIKALKRELKKGTYIPIPLRREYIPKDRPGHFRPLGIPAVRCRVAQEMVRYLLNPIFERTFHDSSHGFREERSCHTAMELLLFYHRQGYRVLVDADVESFYDTINQRLVLKMVECEVADGNILDLIKKFLQAGVMEEGRVKPTSKGVPQGGVISPLLSNIVLNHLDWVLEQHGYKFVRYADDFVVLCETKAQAGKGAGGGAALYRGRPWTQAESREDHDYNVWSGIYLPWLLHLLADHPNGVQSGKEVQEQDPQGHPSQPQPGLTGRREG